MRSAPLAHPPAVRLPRTRRIGSVAVGVAVAVTALCAATVPASAAPSPTRPAAKPPTIVSLGDSFISGEAGRWQGNANPANLLGDRWGTDRAAYDCSSNYAYCYHDARIVYGRSYDDGCDRSDVAEIRSATIAVDGRANLACSGAETVNVLPSSEGGKGFKGEKPQADQLATLARTHDVKMVVVSIGGNDLGFSDILGACVKAFLNPVGSPCNPAQEKVAAKALTATEPKVEHVLRSIRTVMAKAGYATASYRLVLQSYPSPIPTGGQNRYPQTYARETSGGCPFFNADSDWARNSLVPRIAAMARRAAHAQHAEFLDLQNAVNGHEVCAKASQQAVSANTLLSPITGARAEWMRFLTAAGTQGTLQESLHPNRYGQRAFAACLSRVWLHVPGDYACLNTSGLGPDGMYVYAI